MAAHATAPVATAPAALSADLTDALRRLKLGTVRRLAPEVLHTAKVQRWTPEEVLRTLIEAECASRDESNLRNRLRGDDRCLLERQVGRGGSRSLCQSHSRARDCACTWGHRRQFRAQRKSGEIDDYRPQAGLSIGTYDSR